MQANILDFGALPNVDQAQTAAIQAAVDACFQQGGGEVLVPEGTFLTGGIRLRSGVTLHLLTNACLKGTRNPDDYDILLKDTIEPLDTSEMTERTIAEFNDYQRNLRAEINCSNAKQGEFVALLKGADFSGWRLAGSRWHRGLITAVHAHDISIIGEAGSCLDGSDCYDALGEEKYRGPHLVHTFDCKGVVLRGYRCVNSSNWAHALFHTRHIAADHLCVEAGHDGFHMHDCEHVTLCDSEFYTGDDCVAGYGIDDFSMRDCVMNTACSAFRLGGTDITIEHCRAYGPGKYVFRGSLSVEEKREGAVAVKKPNHRYNMLSFFTYYADCQWPIRHQPGNIRISHCSVDHADRFLQYDYCGNEFWQSEKPLRSIEFTDVKATGLILPLVAYGDKEVPLLLKLQDCRFDFSEGSDFMHANYYERICMKNVDISGINGVLVRTFGHPGQLETENLHTTLAENGAVESQEPFYCKPI